MLPALIGLGGSILGGLLSNRANGDEQKTYEEQLQEYGAIDPAAIRELQAEQQGQSAFDGVKADPRMRDSQLRALAGMEQTYAQGGMDAQTLGELNQINGNVAQQDRARRDAIVAQQARKGRGTGGSQYASLLSGAQSAAQSQADASFGAHAAARQRALQAMSETGKMAGGMRDQDFGEQAARAQATDRIGQFNTQMRQQANMQNQQRDQQVVQNRFAKADGRMEARKGKAGALKEEGERTRRQGYGYGSAAGGVFSALGGGK